MANTRTLTSRNKREGKRRKVLIKKFYTMNWNGLFWFKYVPALSRKKVNHE